MIDKEKEILECAEKIKEYCKSFKRCRGCIFDCICRSNGILYMPEYWDLGKIRR